MKVDFYRHGISPDEAEKVAEVLATPFLTSGPVGKKVEAQLCDFFAVPHALLTNSWTNGALAVLLAAGIGPGDEVIVPAMTFIATANVVELVGAKPVFVDVDPETLMMRAQDAHAAVTGKTRAVFPVHLYGQMADVAALRKALGKDILIFEDCAHCFEGTLRGERPGGHSDAAIFSFYATKNVACGEGGAVITHDKTLAARIKMTRMHGMTAGAADRFKTGSYSHWDMGILGAKANLPDLLAALLPDQIANVERRRNERARRARVYRDAFAGNNRIRLPRQVEGCVDAHHLFAVAVPAENRDGTLAALADNGIGATVNYRGLHMMKYYRAKYGFRPEHFPNAHDWGASTLSLPLFPTLPEDEQAHVVDTMLGIAARF